MKRYALTFELPAAHGGVRVARSQVRRLARMFGMPDGEIDNLVLVVSELLANGIDHGAGEPAHDVDDTDEELTMGFEIDPDGWCLRVSDRAGGDPDDVRALIGEGDELPDLEDERGRGFFLMRQMVDELTVERSADGRGLTFTARRRHGAG